jgi:hypothetical protein
MRHSYEIREIIDEPWLVPKLERFLDRKSNASSPDAIIDDESAPASVNRYAVGCTYGRYYERITQREIRRTGVPAWFDPRFNPGQFGIIIDGVRCYIQVELDEQARSAPSTFDNTILSLVEPEPEALSLF